MANGFAITISAVDRASKVMDNITKRINAMNAPLRRFRGSAGKFLDASGINRVAGAFRGWAAAGLNVAGSLVKIVEPLGILTSVASLAGIYKLTSSWAQFGSRLGFDAQRIGIMPQKLQALQGAAEEAGSSAQSLTSGMRNLRDGMVNALGGRDPQTFQTLFQLFPEWNKDTHHLRQALGNLDGFLPQVANKIASIKDPTLRARLATQLFGSAGEDLMPFLLKGSKGINELTAKMAKYGLLNQDGIEKANKLRESMVDLRLASVGLSYAIAQQVGPSLGGLLDWFTNLISVNRETIAANIGKAVKVFADWVKSVDWKTVGNEIHHIFGEVNNVAQAMGGWGAVAKDVGELVGVVMVAKILAGLGRVLSTVLSVTAAIKGMFAAKDTPSGVPPVPKAAPGVMKFAGRAGLFGLAVGALYEGAKYTGINKKWDNVADRAAASSDRFLGTNLGYAYKAWKFFKEQGWTSAQASGIVASLDKESGFQTSRTGDNGDAFGIAQWHADRAANFRKAFGHDLKQSTYDEQLKFIQWELGHTERAAGDALRRTTDAASAGATFSNTYERPADQQGEMRDRGEIAQRWQQRLVERDKYGDNGLSGWASDTLHRIGLKGATTGDPGARGSTSATPPPAATQTLDKAHLTMDVHVHSSSDGSHRVTIPSATVNGQPIQPKIARAMPASGY